MIRHCICKEVKTAVPLFVVLVVNTGCKLAWIRCVSYVAMLPVFVVRKFTPKVEGVVDIGEAEFSILVLEEHSQHFATA